MLAVVVFICLIDSFAIRKANERLRTEIRTDQIQLKQTWNRKQTEIKKAFQTAEKNFATSKENFETIGERLDRIEQEVLNARGDLLKLKVETRDGIKNLKNKLEEVEARQGITTK